MASSRDVAQRGPSIDDVDTGRVRSVDAFRAFAIVTVVIGHWLAFALTVDGSQITGRNLLEIWPPGAWLTWYFQVMPVFFLVGGYAGQASWTRRRSSLAALPWVGARLWRLLVPTALLLGVVLLAAIVARTAGLDPALVRLALTIAGLPLWFLAVYIAAVPLTPVLSAAERRWGLRLPAALLGAALLCDAVSVHLGVGLVGWLNYVFFWLGMYAVGITWRSGALLRHRRLPAALALGGASAVVLLVVAGPYPVAMVGAVGQELQNNGPPSAALVALGVTQVGIVCLLRDTVERWCRSERVWRAVASVNLVAMSVYLWHMVAGIVASLVFWQTGVAALADPPSAEWFAWRPVWYLVCTAVLLVLVRLVRWAERPLPVTSGGPATSVARVGAVVLGVAAACGAMILLGVSGLGAGPPAQPVAILAVFVLGSAMIMGASGLTPTIGRLLRSSSRAPGAALR